MIDGMLSKLKDWKSKIKTKTPVTRISEKPDKKGLTVECRSANATFEYSQVILTAPLGCIQSIDLDDCGLLYNQKLAIRSLQYDASTKVGIKFEKRWWEDPEFMNNRPIVGGISNTDLPIRVCVYPSYGLTCPTSSPPPGILLASYTWAQDARRLGSLAQGKGSEPDKALLELVLDNIAKLHGIPRSKLPQPIDHFAHSWYNDQYTRGAFALFGPAQFGRAGGGGKISPGSMFASMKAPAADGKLHFAGEATSAHHAWVLGSLNSAWRAVFNALNGYDDLQQKLRDNWGTPDEEGPTNLKKLALLAHYGYL
jgi:monoamine oxidase